MKKNYKTLMIPTKSSNIVLYQISKKLDYFETEFSLQEGKSGIPQHLYVLDTKAEIKEGDVVKLGSGGIHKMSNKDMLDYLESDSIATYKIIASTDPSLKLPVIGKSYIEYFIKEWNKGNKIEEIELELRINNKDIVIDSSNQIMPIIPLSLDDKQVAFGSILEEEIDAYYNYEYPANKETGLSNNIYDLALENANRMLALPEAKDNLTILLKNAFIAGAKHQLQLDEERIIKSDSLIRDAQDVAFKAINLGNKIIRKK